MTKSTYSSPESEQGQESTPYGVDAFAISATPFAMSSPIARPLSVDGTVQQVSWPSSPESSQPEGKKRVSWSSSQHKHRVASPGQADESPRPLAVESVRNSQGNEREISWRMHTLDVPQQNGLEPLLLLAEQGDQDAQYAYGMVFAMGRGVIEDAARGASWLLRAAEQGHTQAQLNLARLYAQGRGVPKDEVLAAAWFRRAAESGEPEAQFSMSLICREQGSPFFDPAQSLRWLQSAAQLQHEEALGQMALRFLHGNGVAQDMAEARKLFQLAAEKGSAEAQYQLGQLLDSNGESMLALEWFRQSAAQGHGRAQYALGVLYEQGRAVMQQYGRAAELYLQAAEQGIVDAQYRLANMHLLGMGIPADWSVALRWFRKAAESGHAGAQFNIAKMLTKQLVHMDEPEESHGEGRNVAWKLKRRTTSSTVVTPHQLREIFF